MRTFKKGLNKTATLINNVLIKTAVHKKNENCALVSASTSEATSLVYSHSHSHSRGTRRIFGSAYRFMQTLYDDYLLGGNW